MSRLLSFQFRQRVKRKKRDYKKGRRGHLKVVSVLLYISRMDVTLWNPFSGIIAYTEYLFLLCILTSEYDLYLSISSPSVSLP